MSIIGKNYIIHQSALSGAGTSTVEMFTRVSTYSTSLETSSSELIFTGDGVADNNQLSGPVAIADGRIVIGTLVGAGESVTVLDLNGSPVGVVTLKASGNNGSWKFGGSVDVGCGRIVVGAKSKDSVGGVYVYDINGNEQTILSNPNNGSADYFGGSVAIGNSKIVVGSPGNGKGYVHIYDLDGRLLNELPQTDNTLSFRDRYGESVDVGCGRIVIGSPAAYSESGRVFVYDLFGNFIEAINPTSLGGGSNDRQFGENVVVGSGRIVVGCGNTKEVYVYNLDGDVLIKKLTNPNVDNDSTVEDNSFGQSIDVDDGKIVIGAWGNKDSGASQAGMVFEYNLDGSYVGLGTVHNQFKSQGYKYGRGVAIGNGRIAITEHHTNADTGEIHIFSTENRPHILDLIDDGLR